MDEAKYGAHEKDINTEEKRDKKSTITLSEGNAEYRCRKGRINGENGGI
jgi:hypothetical protein